MNSINNLVTVRSNATIGTLDDLFRDQGIATECGNGEAVAAIYEGSKIMTKEEYSARQMASIGRFIL